MKRICFLCLFLCLTALAARSVQAQTETILYNLPGGSAGGSSGSGLTSDGAGNFYGTSSGGLGYGSVFELSPNGNGGWNENVIYSFDYVDGAGPSGPLIFDNAGNIYGTASRGGDDNNGLVFELSPAGGSWTETVLYCFAGGADGVGPASGVILGPAGNLYGTTEYGGTGGFGIVFEVSPFGGGWTEQVIYDPDDTSGYGITAGLAIDASGNVYGISSEATAFELSPNGRGGWSSTVIHSFPFRGHYGVYGTPALDQAGNIYGTVRNTGPQGWSAGEVYQLSPRKAKWIAHSLQSWSNGKGPWSGVVLDAAGNIYGTTLGGSNKKGSVFELVRPTGTGSYREDVLWNFDGADGTAPTGRLILDIAGNLYGTTLLGGPSDAGVVFELTP
jgi:uncharacterized repeat protein (TIGR03803 family)